MANYGKASPWNSTGVINNNYLGYFKIRPVPAESDDILYELDVRYKYRPDLLSFDLYDTTKLWWVFAQRNMDVIKDPIYDFIPGVKIYLPKGPNLKRLLGT
jgi:hypothetical protein